jgi:hypothetical protein
MLSVLMALILAAATAGAAPAPAQNPDVVDAGTAASRPGHSAPRWSIGTSLTYPLVKIYQLHIGYALDHRHELVFGPCFQNFRHESFTSRAYTLLLGYRYRVGDSLSLEAELYPAYNRIRSHVTGSGYPGVEVWGELKVGYRFDLGDRWYIQPAPGVGFGILRTNPPPKFHEEIRSPTFVPQVILGFRP